MIFGSLAVLIDLENKSSRVLIGSNPEEFLFDECHFANNERVVCRYFRYVVLIAGDIGVARRWYRDGRTVFSRLVAVNTDGTGMMELVNVMIEQSTRFVEALEKADKDFIYIEQANGDHFLSFQSHRIQFMEALDEFLNRHLSTE